MNKTKFTTIFSIAALLSANSVFSKSCDASSYRCMAPTKCTVLVPGQNFYSLDGKFRAKVTGYKSGSQLVRIHKTGRKRCTLAFRSVRSFSFSTDSRYLLIERSVRDKQAGVTNEFLEVFDLKERNRLVYIPFYKRFYAPNKRYRKSKSSVGKLMDVEFSGSRLKSVSYDFDGVVKTVPAKLRNVSSVFTSECAGVLSVRFKDGFIKIYIPNKDFSGLDKVYEFESPTMVNIQDPCCAEDDMGLV